MSVEIVVVPPGDASATRDRLVIVTFKEPRSLVEELDEAAARLRVSRSELIRRAIVQYLRLLEGPLQA